MPTNAVRAVLEAYAVTGVLGLARRDGNRRYYDLLERLLPADVLARKTSAESNSGTSSCPATAPMACSASAAPETSSAGRAGEAGPAVAGYPGRNALREELVERGDLVPVEVEGVRGKRFVIKEDVELLEAPPDPPPSVAFLPRSIRSSGTAPCLGACSTSTTSGSSSSHRRSAVGAGTCCRSFSGDRFVGRIEPRIDRDEARVEVLGVWWEDGFAPSRVDGFVDAMRDALRDYLSFAGADRIVWAPKLGAEKRLFLTQP